MTVPGSVAGERGGWVDYQGGAYHAEEVGILDCFLGVEPVILGEGFTEEGHLRLEDPATGVIGDLSLPDDRVEFPGGDPVFASHAAAELEISMDTPDGPGSSPLMEIVDILGDNGYLMVLLKAGDGQVSRVGAGPLQHFQEFGRELVERFWVGPEGGYIEEAEILRIAVETVSGAEVRDSALGGDSRPG